MFCLSVSSYIGRAADVRLGADRLSVVLVRTKQVVCSDGIISLILKNRILNIVDRVAKVDKRVDTIVI